MDPAVQAWGCPPGGHGAVTVRQMTVTAIAVATGFTKKDPAVEGVSQMPGKSSGPCDG